MRVRGLILTVGAVAAVACSGSGNDAQAPTDQSPEGNVLVRNNFFDPTELDVAPGTSVVWTWASNGVEHSIVFADSDSSGRQGSGTYQRSFATLGSYPYLCSVHGASMSGVIDVVSAPPPGGGGGGGGGGGYGVHSGGN